MNVFRDYLMEWSSSAITEHRLVHGIHLPTKQMVTMKITDLRRSHQQSTFFREQRIMKRLQELPDTRCVPLLDTFVVEEVGFLVMKRLPTDLYTCLSTRHISEQEKLDLFQQLLRALRSLHQNGIAHMDVKPENILLDGRRLYICDFEHAYEFGTDATCSGLCGSPFYTAPEMHLDESYDATTADIWSAGVAFYVLLTGRFPFIRGEDGQYQFCLQESQSVSQLTFQLVKAILQVVPAYRPSLTRILCDPIFTSQHRDTDGRVRDSSSLPPAIFSR